MNSEIETAPLLDVTRPLVTQLLTLKSSAAYEAWMINTIQSSTGPFEVKLFHSPHLERLSWTPWFVVPILWLPIVFLCVSYYITASLNPTLACGICLFSLGWCNWSLAEYLTHRFVFHAIPADNGISIMIAFLSHGVHHLAPHDEGRLVFPPILASIIAFIFFFAFRVPFHSLSQPSYVLVFAGGLFGYVVYDCIHYGIHHSKLMAHFPLTKYLQSHHLAHHKIGNAGFGVSGPLWDFVFGTALPYRYQNEMINSNKKKESVINPTSPSLAANLETTKKD
jgi:sterol desaturase/sphingolipid hydroxylase (fatty acid hydroxylase superfamily)